MFGFIDSIEAVDLATPQLNFLEGTYFWEADPRYAQSNQSEFDKFYRQTVGVDSNGARHERCQGRDDLFPHVRLLGDIVHH